MKKRILAIVMVLAMILSLSLAGCTKPAETTTAAPTEAPTEGVEPADEAVFNWNVGADPKTIDPCLNGASDGGDVINQTFEGLVREKSGVIYPGIAESWDVSEDGLTVTFNLRESKWSDGSPLTAHDFVYSWKRGMDPATASEYSWIWEYTNIVGAYAAVEGESLDAVGVSAPDDNTLVVQLETPTDYIVSLLSFYHFMPTKQSAVEAGADGAWAKDPANAVSNGPFKLTAYTIGEGLTLVKNENYWNADAVKLDRIEGKFIDEASTAYQAYQSGELDFLPDVPAAEIPSLIAEDPNFYVFPLLGTYYYNFNMDLELFQDPKVRRALTLAVDREMICETMGSGQVPAAGFVPPGFLDHEGNDFFETAGTYGIATDDSKIAEAQQLLAEAGYPNGEGFPEFTIMYNTSEGHQLVAELIQEMFKTNLGINTKLENQEWAVFQDTRKAGDYELSRGGWLTDFMDPMGLLSIFTSENAYNDPNYYNEAYDTLLSSAAKTRGAEHFEALYEAQEMLMTDLPIIPIYHYTDVMLVSPRLQGWDRSVLGTVDFSGASIAE
ncbi:MAG: peptide ABC transporter substrate-binding protein [Tissierellales bacterium]|nr:peptide ABC transporter substrate-binding protein [Tissierellales bacterium]MBN2826566.1 peptide ABC transporter substrate-binding protein [Tissierellales bacterium]